MAFGQRVVCCELVMTMITLLNSAGGATIKVRQSYQEVDVNAWRVLKMARLTGIEPVTFSFGN